MFGRLRIRASALREMARARVALSRQRAQERQRIERNVAVEVRDDLNAALVQSGLEPSTTPLIREGRTRVRQPKPQRDEVQQETRDFFNALLKGWVIAAGAAALAMFGGKYDETSVPLPDPLPMPAGVSGPAFPDDRNSERFIVDINASSDDRRVFVSRREEGRLNAERRSITLDHHDGGISVSAEGGRNTAVDRAWVMSQGPRAFTLAPSDRTDTDGDGIEEARLDVPDDAVTRRNAMAVAEFSDGSSGMVALP